MILFWVIARKEIRRTGYKIIGDAEVLVPWANGDQWGVQVVAFIWNWSANGKNCRTRSKCVYRARYLCWGHWLPLFRPSWRPGSSWTQSENCPRRWSLWSAPRVDQYRPIHLWEDNWIWGYGTNLMWGLRDIPKHLERSFVWVVKSSQKALEQGFTAAAFQRGFFPMYVVTLHLRPSHKHLIGKTEDLMMMKDGAFFINTARAELVEKMASENVLKSGKIFCSPDVYLEMNRYTIRDFPLLKYNQVICKCPIWVMSSGTAMSCIFQKHLRILFVFDNGTPLLNLQNWK